MTYFEKSGPYTVCSIGGAFGDPNVKYEWWFRGQQFDVNLPSAEAAREACRTHAKTQRVAA